MKYRVVCITNNDKSQKGRVFNNDEFPNLVKRIRDEEELFVVNEEDPEDYWFAEEFFLMEPCKRFIIMEK